MTSLGAGKLAWFSGSTALELSMARLSSTHDDAANCENHKKGICSSLPRPVVTNEARLAAARDPCTVRPKKEQLARLRLGKTDKTSPV